MTNKSDNEVMEQILGIVNKYNITHAISQTLDKAYLFKYLPAHIKKIAACHVQPFSFMGITRKRIWNTNAQNTRQFFFKCASLLSPSIYENFFYKFEKEALENSYKYADKICFISESFFPRIKRYMPTFPQDKFVAINNPNTFDVSKIEFAEDKENIILWIGRVENATKNAIDFINQKKRTLRSLVFCGGLSVGASSLICCMKTNLLLLED